MTLQSILQRGREEFEKFIPEPEQSEWLAHHQSEILEAVVEMCEEKSNNDPYDHGTCEGTGYRQALADIISELKMVK